MTWERQDGAGQHQRLGTRSKAVIREKRRGLGQGALGHLSYAPEAGGDGETERPTLTGTRTAPTQLLQLLEFPITKWEGKKVMLLKTKCESAGPERDRQQGHAGCADRKEGAPAMGVADWMWAMEEGPALLLTPTPPPCATRCSNSSCHSTGQQWPGSLSTLTSLSLQT